MRIALVLPMLLALGLASACKDLAPAAAPAAAASGVPDDPRTLYKLEAKASPASAGDTGTLHLAIRPIEGAVVKAETPFRATLEASGQVGLLKTELSFADRAREEGSGPIFEIPFDAKEAGEGSIDADLTFFVCVEEACLRTTEKVSVPVTVN